MQLYFLNCLYREIWYSELKNMAIYVFLCLRLMEGLKSENRENTWKFTKEKSVFPPIFNSFYLEAWKLFILSQTYNQTRKYINFGSIFLKVFLGAKMLQNWIFELFWAFLTILTPRNTPTKISEPKLKHFLFW